MTFQSNQRNMHVFDWNTNLYTRQWLSDMVQFRVVKLYLCSRGDDMDEIEVTICLMTPLQGLHSHLHIHPHPGHQNDLFFYVNMSHFQFQNLFLKKQFVSKLLYAHGPCILVPNSLNTYDEIYSKRCLLFNKPRIREEELGNMG